MNVAIFVALEKHGDDRQLPDIKYAEADVRALASALGQHDFTPENSEILVNAQATKTSIESSLRIVLKRLTSDDTLFFFYIGHGFSAGEQNYLTCFDSRPGDLEQTSLPLNWLQQQFSRTSCQRIACFLNVRHSDWAPQQIAAEDAAEFDENSVAALLERIDGGVCFTSCSAGETSHVSSALKHGIWAYHLIQSFEGKNRLALEHPRLTAAALQDYLSIAVAETLRTTVPNGRQTPLLFSATDHPLELARLDDVQRQRQQAQHPLAGQVKDSILLAESVVSIKRLAGYTKNKRHFLPDHHSSRAQSFINEVADTDLKEDVERVRSALKTVFQLRRTQLSAQYDGEGGATITTPFFNYNISVAQSPDDPASVVWRRSVDAIVEPEQVLSAAFDQVFAQVFDTVELSLHGAVDLEQLIDTIEAGDRNAIQVEYNDQPQIASCTITVHGYNVAIRVTPGTFAVVHPRPQLPKRLVQSLFEIQDSLQQEHAIAAIPFTGARR